VNRLAGYAPHGASEKTFGTAGRGLLLTGRWGFNHETLATKAL